MRWKHSKGHKWTLAPGVLKAASKALVNIGKLVVSYILCSLTEIATLNWESI
ncbi:hypothetical protein LVD15_01730 [Fulvivirga maritima]|uniref:hypothetical protein n=1 Tax=Fulvivirga maritima TaxID=2904247 RepID=UPI001F20A508|nr:hypothetical protein [Fulvivirga maritima]UII27171.1 hypothetical protein LVD15_01730 [Fulvivirga maritima]